MTGLQYHRARYSCDCYSRFGFSARLVERLKAPFSGPAFMALELVPGALGSFTGEVRYRHLWSGARMKFPGVITFWSRSFEEYRLIFGLTESDLGGLILGCGDGPASFNAEATALGHRVISCDPTYEYLGTEFERGVEACYDVVVSQVKENIDKYNWSYFRDPDHLGQYRLAAMRKFLADFDLGKQAGRYVTASLPELPFEDGQFSLALVSHLLFLYSSQFDCDFHVAAVEELLRVACEIRMFPLVDLNRQWSPHVGPVREHLERAGFQVEIVAVEYEFQKAKDHAGNRMMRIRRDQPR